MFVNRYQIYEMKGRRVRAMIPPRFGGGDVTGDVVNVYRDVAKKTISIKFSEQELVFREPTDVVCDGNMVSFVYKESVESVEQDGELVEAEPVVVAVVSFEILT